MGNAAIQAMEQTLDRSARGEAAAFEEIMRQHQSMVYSLCYHFLHDSYRAEEAAQDVFVRLYRNMSSIQSASHLVRWLRKVAYRRCIDESRKMPELPPVTLQDIENFPAEHSETDPWLSRHLRLLVASLPLDARMIVILRFQEDLDLTEIAEVMEIPLNTAKSRLQRSLDILRTKLGRYTGDVRI